MLKIAICDDDFKFTGKLENLTLQESHNLGIRAIPTFFLTAKPYWKAFKTEIITTLY